MDILAAIADVVTILVGLVLVVFLIVFMVVFLKVWRVFRRFKRGSNNVKDFVSTAQSFGVSKASLLSALGFAKAFDNVFRKEGEKSKKSKTKKKKEEKKEEEKEE